MDEKANITPEENENNVSETVVEVTPVVEVPPVVDTIPAVEVPPVVEATPVADVDFNQAAVPIVEPILQMNAGTQNPGNSNYNNNTGYNPNYVNEVQDETPMTMGDWVLTILALMIPCGVGIILYFIWAFGKKGNVNRRNYCRAWLIISGIVLVIYILFLLIFGAAFYSSVRSGF